MKRIFLIAITLFCASQLGFGFKGRVLDKVSGEPVGWATVALMTQDSTLVAGTSCDEKGEYSLTAVPGDYMMTVSLIGYKDSSRSICIAPDTDVVEDVLLEEDSRMLAGATVTERVSFVEMKIDKLVVNVKESAFAQGSNALELMKKAPGVTIDKDGNVKLNGKSVSVWIDGRPSYVDGKSLEALLRSTNSESIDKFEIMEHPSAKYDAAGQGGIINIKTKRNVLQGFNGSMGLGGGGMYFSEIDSVPWQQSYWLNLGYRTNKTNTFFSIYEGFYNSPVKISNDLRMEDMGFLQSGVSSVNDFYHNYNVKIGTDWFLDSKNTLGFIAYVPGERNMFNSQYSHTDQYLGGVLAQGTRSKIENGPSNALRHNFNLNYTHIFDEALSSEITANLDYYHNASSESNSQVDTLSYPSGLQQIARQSMDSNSLYDIYSAKADYQGIVWQKFMLEAGAKWALSCTDNKSLEVQPQLPAPRQIDFIYREHIAAVYASLAGQLGPKWSFKAGLRGEYTNSFGDWITLMDQTRRSYFDLFPTVYLGWQPSEKWRYSLSYSRRVGRPQYEQMNPTHIFLDAKTYVMGDPDILPQYNDDVSLSVGFGQHLSLALAYDYTDNVIQQNPSFEPGGVQYFTWGNLGKQRIGVVSFNVAALPVTKWLQWTLNLTDLAIGTTSNASGIDRKCNSMQAYTDLSFLLPKGWKIDLDGNYSSPLIFGCFYVHSMYTSDLAVKKNLLNDRMTLGIRLDDVFRTMNTNLDVLDESGSGAVTSIKQEYYGQKLLLDITWNFGKAQKPLRQRNVGNLEEMSRVGSGQSSGLGK